jgi:K+-transporting ATPase KdpF subunit
MRRLHESAQPDTAATPESWKAMTVIAGVVALLLLGYLLFALVHPERF